MKKISSLVLAFVLVFGVLAGCGQNEQAEVSPSPTTTATAEPDAVTTASIVNTNEAFEKAISKEGTWIIATLTDLTFDKELVLEGEFTHNDAKARKIALYAQDDDRNITASYKLTAPKLTVKSENARIQGGTFVGDVYVEANGFTLPEATIEGNLYFANEEYKNSFDLVTGKVTGVIEVK